jgi:hypothetical protein
VRTILINLREGKKGGLVHKNGVAAAAFRQRNVFPEKCVKQKKEGIGDESNNKVLVSIGCMSLLRFNDSDR